MKKIFIFTDGQTEERFIKTLVQPHLETIGIYPTPVLATTKVVKAGTNFRGGTVSYHKARKQIRNLLNDSSAAGVTTMLDYYGLHESFPGRGDPTGASCYERVRFVENEIACDIGHQKFMPFLTLHEFEGLLFSSPEDMAAALPGGMNLTSRFTAIRNGFRTPEEINDSSRTAPSRRITDVYPEYQKPADGSRIAARIGLEKIRLECPHFSEWISRLEQLGN